MLGECAMIGGTEALMTRYAMWGTDANVGSGNRCRDTR